MSGFAVSWPSAPYTIVCDVVACVDEFTRTIRFITIGPR
jgi:hypothetical protein